MKNLKPSQLPVGTVIGTEAHYEELYIKREGNYWEDLFSGCGHCEDSVRVGDEGCDHNVVHSAYGCRNTVSYTSDIYFTDYKIIALPPGFILDSETLHGFLISGGGVLEYQDGTRPDHDCGGFNCEES